MKASRRLPIHIARPDEVPPVTSMFPLGRCVVGGPLARRVEIGHHGATTSASREVSRRKQTISSERGKGKRVASL